VAGILKGRDVPGEYIGVAPDVRLLSLKVTGDNGSGTESDLVTALQWVFDNRIANNIRVVNLSVGASVASSYLTSPISAAVEQLWLNGVVVVASAGNNGSAANATWYGPANDPFIITVGALDNNSTIAPIDDKLADYSSRGKTQDGFYKPDIVAPGSNIASTLAPGSAVAQQYPTRIVDTDYIRLSGTSMAAPMVSGVVSLLLQARPNLTPNQVKWVLQNSQRTYPGQADSAGEVDAPKALQVASGPLGQANQGIAPNQRLNSTTNTVVGGQTYWAQTYWSQTYWGQISSNQTYWD
jgi:serine protease AprX